MGHFWEKWICKIKERIKQIDIIDIRCYSEIRRISIFDKRSDAMARAKGADVLYPSLPQAGMLRNGYHGEGP